MKILISTIWALVCSINILPCIAQKRNPFKPKEVYRSNDLVLTQIAENAFVHTSFKQTNDFGYVPCNGLIVRNNGESVVFDTPTNDTTSLALIRWIQHTLGCKVNAIIPTHFHDDCLGGLKAFHEQGIPSYAYVQTIALAKEHHYVVPQNSFSDSLLLPMGDVNISAKFFGEGHTRDNVVGFFPAEKILFGGCLIKELKAGKGYLGDANVAQWSATVEKIKEQYPQLKIVVPGHGAFGSKKLLDYTISLFR